MMPTLADIARLFNGKVHSNYVTIHARGHENSKGPHELSIEVGSQYPDGILVNCFTPSEDGMEQKRWILEELDRAYGYKPEKKTTRRRSNTLTPEQLLAKMNATLADATPRKLIAEFPYVNAKGELRYTIQKFEGKQFNCQYADDDAKNERHLFRLPEVRDYPTIKMFATEGEKDATNLWDAGICATTAAYGSWDQCDLSVLQGRDITVLVDNDEAGYTKAEKLAALLLSIAKRVRILLLPNLPVHGDVSDWLMSNRSEDLVDALYDKGPLAKIALSPEEWHLRRHVKDVDAEMEHGTVGAKEDGNVINLVKPAAEPKPDSKPKGLTYRKHRDVNNPQPKWLVKNLLPEVGTGLLSGQSGTYKSFVALKLAGCITKERSFAGHVIKRPGAVLIFASEGASELPTRLEALAEDEHGGDVLPIYFVSEPVRLLDQTSIMGIVETAKNVAGDAMRDHNLPLALIMFDTLIGSSGFSEKGDENDNALGQRLMGALNVIAQMTSTFCLAIDHFGKAVETGTRGASSKEAAADTVLALLADKALSGEVTGQRLCIRKRRSGPAGIEHPFSINIVNLGMDEDSEPVTSLTVTFGTALPPPTKDEGVNWGKSPHVVLLRKILMTMVATSGEQIMPFADSPTPVLAVQSDYVRAEFYKQTPNDVADSKRKAYLRAVRIAQSKDRICVREVAGDEWIWLVKPEKDQK